MPLDLESTYLSLDGQGGVARHEGGENFWRTMDQNPEILGTLLTAMTGEGDWPQWEMHPEGDEILILLEGRLTMILDRDGRESRVEMTPGATLVVPKGAWHRAVDQQGVRMLFVTYGAGTTHRPA
ncbi:cupin domain-containing protein [Phenylobacterium sp.]|uniref:cupin domain-containing protein n=1 Tax=Phenylobacterium sp. TaxID=1871053 RepID=UPI00286CB8C0|nr:cupin domain-containing protein [Phenylobacterium sp.]